MINILTINQILDKQKIQIKQQFFFSNLFLNFVV